MCQVEQVFEQCSYLKTRTYLFQQGLQICLKTPRQTCYCHQFSLFWHILAYFAHVL